MSTGTQDLNEDYSSDLLVDDLEMLHISHNLTSCIGVHQHQDAHIITLPIECSASISSIIMKFINDFNLGINVNSIIFAKLLSKLKKVFYSK